jgi:hypothetical protein
VNEYSDYRVRELEKFEKRARGTIERTPKNTLFQHRNGAAPMLAATAEQITDPLPEGRVRRKPLPVIHNQNPVSIVDRAIERGLTGADLKEIMDLHERWEAGQARKAFDIAMANAQAEIPTIVKNRLVNFEGRNGSRSTNYRHEDLAEIVETIRPILHKHGLAHRFKTSQNLETGMVVVTCIVTGHGHREETPLAAKPDSNSSSMNDLQRLGSVTTYLQRYTLKAALGLAASNDDDGRGGNAKAADVASPAPGTISIAQAEQIRALLDKRGLSHRAYLQFIRLPRIEDIGIEHFNKAVRAIESLGART